MNYVLVGIREVHKKPVLATAAPLRATVQDLPTTATHTPLSTATAGECLPHDRPIPKPRASVGDSISHGGMNNARVVRVPTEHSGVGELPFAESSGAAVSSAVKSKSTRAATVHSPATSYQQAPQRPGFVQPSSAGLPSAEPSVSSAVKSKSTRAATAHSPATSYQQAPQQPGFVQPSSAGLPSAEPSVSSAVKSKSTRAATAHSPATSYQQAPQQPGFVQPSSAGLPRGAGLTLPSAAQCQVKPEQATAAPAIPHPPTVSSPDWSSLVAQAQQPLSIFGAMPTPPRSGHTFSSAQPTTSTLCTAPPGTFGFVGAVSTLQHITPVFPDPTGLRVELLPPTGRAVAIDDQQFVAHSMLGSRVLGSVGVSQATTAAAPVQVQPAEVAPPTPISFKIVNVVVKSSIQ